MQPLRVYLDSSDFSTLSGKSGQSVEYRELLKRLLEYADHGFVSYYFSGVHISEMSPIQSRDTEMARQRGEVLVKLCKRNCFVSLEQMWKKELCVAHGIENLQSVFSSNGDWFPENIFDTSPVKDADLIAQVLDELGSHNLNRAQRRLAKRKVSKSGLLRKDQKTFIQQQARHGDYQEMLTKYPMREQDAKLILRYLIGDQVSKSEAENAYLESLRDLTWMMQWFAQHHDTLLPIVELVRKPARTMHQSFQTIIESYQAIRLSSNWKQNQIQEWHRQLLISLPNRLSADLFADSPLPKLSEDTISRNLHGVKSMIDLMFEILMLSLTEKTPRLPMLSDAVDAMHAVHMPYVDIFRADATMAPILKKLAMNYGTKIVGKLAQLPDAIERELTLRG